jgi:hypothetical protein
MLHVENKISKNIANVPFNLVWKNRTHYIKTSVIMKRVGLNFLDFPTLNSTLD